MTIINGVSYTVTAPHKYSMQYLLEKVEYNEPFVMLDFSKEAAKKYLDDFDTWVHGISGFFAATGAGGAAVSLGISAGVCAAIAGIVEVAGAVIKNWAVNADGSVSLCLSYHYAGTRNNGMDLTAVPLPGFDCNEWYKIVNGLMMHRANAEKAKTLKIENEPFLQIEATGLSANGGKTPEGSPYKPMNESMNAQGGFYASFSSCMAASHMPVPANFFETAERAISTLTAMATAYATYGTELRLTVLFTQGVALDFAVAGAGVLASAYFGIAIGCCLSAGISILDLPSLF